MSQGNYSREEIERGIARIYEVVLNTKNITARYIVIIALASLWVDAYDFAAFTFATAAFKNTFPWMSTWLFGLAVASVQLGATIGSIVGGWLTDRIGRRNMFILNMIFFTVMAAGAGLAPDPYTFTVFRTLLGFALGADTATGFAYIFEYLEKQQRLFWSNLWQLQWYIMYEVVILIFVLPFYFITHSLTNPWFWRIIMFGGAVFAFIILMLRARIPESVLWEAYRGRLATAKRILKRTYGIDLPDVPDVDVELRRPARGLRSAFKIFRRNKWKELVYCFNGNFEQAFEFYTFGFYMPYILLTMHLAGPLATIEASAIFYGVGVIAGVLTAYLTPRIGTKSQYVIGATISGISLFGLAFTFIYHWPLWLFVLFASTFYFGHVIGPASQGMTSINAAFGASERGTAAGWGYFWVKLAAVVGSFIAPTWLVVLGAPRMTEILGIYALATAILGLIIGFDARKYKPPEEEEVTVKPS
ncbi:MFS transporter [Vulcanisaeta thermophila]|uniref:MFS transporter n=1 Tax=Vulcanisaeta thermophila TaxID=867917 RepID=UPI00085328A4|nr:MFS transporter [Vulcanisaeta thermophila]